MNVIASDLLNPLLLLQDNYYEQTNNHIPFSPPPPQQNTPPPSFNSAIPPQLNLAVPAQGGTQGMQIPSDGDDSDSDSDADSAVGSNEAVQPPLAANDEIDEDDMERQMSAIHYVETPNMLFHQSEAFAWTELFERLARHEAPAFEFLYEVDEQMFSLFQESPPPSGTRSPSSVRVNLGSGELSSMSASFVLSTRSPSPGATPVAFAGGQVRRPEMPGHFFLWLVPAIHLPRQAGGRN